MKSDSSTSSSASSSSPVADHRQITMQPQTPSREALEIERANTEEDKYRVWLFHSGFCGHYVNFSAFWTSMFVLEVFADQRDSLIATYAIGLPSIVIIMSGIGALRSKVRNERKFYNIIMSIFALLFLMTVNVTCQVFFYYFDQVEGITALLQIFWGSLTVLAVTIPIDILSPIHEDDPHMNKIYMGSVWFFEVMSTGSLLFALDETYKDGETPSGFRYVLAYAFAANIIVYSCIVPALRTKISRVQFMFALNLVTNVPVIIVALGTGSHISKTAVPIVILFCTLQCCHDMVYELVKTMHDECERHELELEKEQSLELGDGVPNTSRMWGGVDQGEGLPQNPGRMGFDGGLSASNSTDAGATPYRQNRY